MAFLLEMLIDNLSSEPSSLAVDLLQVSEEWGSMSKLAADAADPFKFNEDLAKIVSSKLKKDLGASTVKQTTRGTGAAAMKRQFVVRWESQGWAINFWIYDGQASSFGSLIFKGPEGAKSLSGIVIPSFSA